MDKKFSRKPVANFFIKRDLQLRLILKIVLAVLISTAVCVATLLLTYVAKYESTVFYRVTFDLGASIGNRENIITIILPSLIIASIINIIIAFFIGLYASRKYAVPIFKLEKWVHLLRDGHMSAQLQFREKEEMRELCSNCNQLSEELRAKFEQIEKYIDEFKEKPDDPEPYNSIKEILEEMEIKSEAIEVHTSFIQTQQLPKDNSR